MVAIDRVVVPFADTIVILTPTAVSFGTWVPPVSEEPAPEPPKLEEEPDVPLGKTGKGKKKKKARPRPSSPLPEPPHEDVETNGQDSNRPAECPGVMSLSDGLEGDIGPSISGRNTISSIPVEPKTETTILPEESTTSGPDTMPCQDPAKEESVDCYRVSSAALILASKRLKTMLTDGKWAEGNKQSDGFFHIKTEGWDTEAFTIMVNVFHHRNYEVPRSVSLELMAKIAILVDYYECEEALKVYSDIWIDGLRESFPVPRYYCQDLMLWILIARVFGLAQEFEKATKVAIMDGNETVQTLDLPIWPTIVDSIDNQRFQAIESIMAKLCNLRDYYRSTAYICPVDDSLSLACGSMLFGALTKEMESHRLLSPRPEVPFIKMSLNGLIEKVCSINSPRWVDSNYGHYSRRYNQIHMCALKQTLAEFLESVTGIVQGLTLKKDYTRSVGDL